MQKTSITIDLNSPQKKYINVNYHFVFPKAENEMILRFPVWSPGSYLIREYEANVEDFTATDSRGHSLKFDKTDKATWKIFLNNAREVRVNYRVYAGDLSVRGAYADGDVVFANMPALLFYPDGQLDQQVRLRLKLPRGWKLSLAK